MPLLPPHVEDMATGECLEPRGVCVPPSLQTPPQGAGPGGAYHPGLSFQTGVRTLLATGLFTHRHRGEEGDCLPPATQSALNT